MGEGRLLHLVSQLLPSGPVGNTALVSSDMQMKSSEEHDLAGAILNLCATKSCADKIRSIQHVPTVGTHLKACL